jgi:hypothetical protein
MGCGWALAWRRESAIVPRARPERWPPALMTGRAIKVAGRASRCGSAEEGGPTRRSVSPTVSPTRHF